MAIWPEAPLGAFLENPFSRRSRGNEALIFEESGSWFRSQSEPPYVAH